MFGRYFDQQKYRAAVSQETHERHVGYAREFLGLFSSFCDTLSPQALVALKPDSGQRLLLRSYAALSGVAGVAAKGVCVDPRGAALGIAVLTPPSVMMSSMPAEDALSGLLFVSVSPILPTYSELLWNVSSGVPGYMRLEVPGVPIAPFEFQFYERQLESQEDLDALAPFDVPKCQTHTLIANGNQIIVDCEHKGLFTHMSHTDRYVYLGGFEAGEAERHVYAYNTKGRDLRTRRKSLVELLDFTPSVSHS